MVKKQVTNLGLDPELGNVALEISNYGEKDYSEQTNQKID